MTSPGFGGDTREHNICSRGARALPMLACWLHQWMSHLRCKHASRNGCSMAESGQTQINGQSWPFRLQMTRLGAYLQVQCC